LVEGQDDLYAIAELMGHHINWPDKKANAPVKVESCGGVEEILSADFIPLKLKSREVEILGIVIDANDAVAARWASLRALCAVAFLDIPADLPPTGLIRQNDEGKRLGVWIMPDNSTRGMMETFMKYLVPKPEEPIWKLAQKSAIEARRAGAKYRDAHADKANIFTWLAWQDPPGQTIGTALLQKLLDAHAPSALPFIRWFRELFQL
jgi:hypothetical protein